MATLHLLPLYLAWKLHCIWACNFGNIPYYLKIFQRHFKHHWCAWIIRMKKRSTPLDPKELEFVVEGQSQSHLVMHWKRNLLIFLHFILLLIMVIIFWGIFLPFPSGGELNKGGEGVLLLIYLHLLPGCCIGIGWDCFKPCHRLSQAIKSPLWSHHLLYRIFQMDLQMWLLNLNLNVEQ